MRPARREECAGPRTYALWAAIVAARTTAAAPADDVQRRFAEAETRDGGGPRWKAAEGVPLQARRARDRGCLTPNAASELLSPEPRSLEVHLGRCERGAGRTRRVQPALRPPHRPRHAGVCEMATRGPDDMASSDSSAPRGTNSWIPTPTRSTRRSSLAAGLAAMPRGARRCLDDALASGSSA
jgi:hypothetical protein